MLSTFEATARRSPLAAPATPRLAAPGRLAGGRSPRSTRTRRLPTAPARSAGAPRPRHRSPAALAAPREHLARLEADRRPQRLVAQREALRKGMNFVTTISPSGAIPTSLPMASGGSGTQPRQRATVERPFPSQLEQLDRLARAVTRPPRASPRPSPDPGAREAVRHEHGRIGRRRHAGSPSAGSSGLRRRAAGQIRQDARRAARVSTAIAQSPAPGSSPLASTSPASGRSSRSSGWSKPQMEPSAPGAGAESHGGRSGGEHANSARRSSERRQRARGYSTFFRYWPV